MSYLLHNKVIIVTKFNICKLLFVHEYKKIEVLLIHIKKID